MRFFALAVVLLVARAIVGTHLVDAGFSAMEAESAASVCSSNAHLYGCATP